MACAELVRMRLDRDCIFIQKSYNENRPVIVSLLEQSGRPHSRQKPGKEVQSGLIEPILFGFASILFTGNERSEMKLTRNIRFFLSVMITLILAFPAIARADSGGSNAGEAFNIEVVGHNDLGRRGCTALVSFHRHRVARSFLRRIRR